MREGVGESPVPSTPEVYWSYERGGSQIAGVEPPRVAIEATQARLAIKMMKPLYDGGDHMRG